MELRKILRTLYAVEQPQGCAEEEIAAVRELFGALPAAVVEFYRLSGEDLTVVQAKLAKLPAILHKMWEGSTKPSAAEPRRRVMPPCWRP